MKKPRLVQPGLLVVSGTLFWQGLMQVRIGDNQGIGKRYNRVYGVGFVEPTDPATGCKLNRKNHWFCQHKSGISLCEDPILVKLVVTRPKKKRSRSGEANLQPSSWQKKVRYTDVKKD